MKGSKLLISALVIAVIAVPITIIITSKSSINKKTKFESLIEDIDKALDSGSANIQNLLIDGSESAYSAHSWLRILKRAHLFGKKQGEFSFLNNLSGRALKEYPGNEKIASVKVISSMEAGDSDSAWSIAQDHLTSEATRSINVESFLRSAAEKSSKDSNELVHPLAEVSQSRNPELFIESYKVTKDRRFLFDAALLELSTGNHAESLDLINRAGGTAQVNYVKALVLYDLSNFSQSYDHLIRELEKGEMNPENTAKIHLICADTLIKQKKLKESIFHYRESVAISPQISPVPYLNLGRNFNNVRGKSVFLKRGSIHFPKNVKLKGAFGISLMESGDIQDAKTYLTNALPDDENGNLSLLVLSELLPRTNETRLTVKLKQLLRENPGNHRIGRYFAWQSAARRDFEQIEDILRTAYYSASDKSWYRFYRAVISTASGEERKFPSPAEGIYGWYGTYNRVVLEQRRGKGDAALSLLERLTEDTNSYEIPSTDIADALAMKGEIHQNQGDSVIIIRKIIEKGLEIDPLNLRLHALKTTIANNST